MLWLSTETRKQGLVTCTVRVLSPRAVPCAVVPLCPEDTVSLQSRSASYIYTLSVPLPPRFLSFRKRRCSLYGWSFFSPLLDAPRPHVSLFANHRLLQIEASRWRMEDALISGYSDILKWVSWNLCPFERIMEIDSPVEPKTCLVTGSCFKNGARYGSHVFGVGCKSNQKVVSYFHDIGASNVLVIMPCQAIATGSPRTHSWLWLMITFLF